MSTQHYKTEVKKFIKDFFKGKIPKSATIKKLVEQFIKNNNFVSSDYHLIREDIVKAIEELSWEGEIEIIAGLGLAADDDIEFLAREELGVKI